MEKISRKVFALPIFDMRGVSHPLLKTRLRTVIHRYIIIDGIFIFLIFHNR